MAICWNTEEISADYVRNVAMPAAMLQVEGTPQTKKFHATGFNRETNGITHYHVHAVHAMNHIDAQEDAEREMNIVLQSHILPHPYGYRERCEHYFAENEDVLPCPQDVTLAVVVVDGTGAVVGYAEAPVYWWDEYGDSIDAGLTPQDLAENCITVGLPQNA